MTVHTTLSVDEARAALGAALHAVHGPGVRLEGWVAEPLTRHGRGRVVRYDVRARVAGARGEDDRRHLWVGKFYERDDEGRLVATTLRALLGDGCAARGGFVLPAVVDYYRPRHLLLLCYEPGDPMTPAIAHADGAAVRAVGRALAALHAARVTPTDQTTAADVFGALPGKVERLSGRFPPHAESLRAALEDLERDVPPAPPQPSFLHGDFGPAQLLWQGDRPVILDFDRATRGDPALDLGNLLAQLYRSALRKPGRLPDVASLRSGMLQEYARWTPPDPELSRRVSWYQRATLLRKTHALAFDTTRHPEPEALQRRHDEATQLLCAIARDFARSS